MRPLYGDAADIKRRAGEHEKMVRQQQRLLKADLATQAKRLIGDLEYGCAADFTQYRPAALAIARAYLRLTAQPENDCKTTTEESHGQASNPECLNPFHVHHKSPRTTKKSDAVFQSMREALEESVKLQSHYAKLLNMHDGGERLQFHSAEEWVARLAALADAVAEEEK